MKKKLIVLSVDSLFDEDMEYLKTLPNFGRLICRASYAPDGMGSVYPSCTYPAHASLITGTWPERHGIYHNERPEPGKPCLDWFWYREDLKAETLLDAAHRAGLTTACVSWPCMGADPSVDWLVAEIWPESREEDPRPVLRKACSANMLAPGGVLERHWHKLRKTDKPFMDHMMVGCSCDIIRRYRPDVMFIHLAYLDDARHGNGVHGPAVRQAIIANDDWFGRLEEAAMDAGTYEDTNFAVISDHGHLDVLRVFRPNVLLAEAGLLDVDGEGRIRDWRAYCHSASLSCQVFLRDPGDGESRRAVEKLLGTMDRTYGVERVLRREEAQREYHLDGPFSYILEGKAGTGFDGGCTGRPVVFPGDSDCCFPRASHGHMPWKGPQPVFIAAGPDIREGVIISNRHIVDEAPTFARMLGLALPEAQGEAMTEILKQENINSI